MFDAGSIVSQITLDESDFQRGAESVEQSSEQMQD